MIDKTLIFYSIFGGKVDVFYGHPNKNFEDKRLYCLASFRERFQIASIALIACFLGAPPLKNSGDTTFEPTI